MKKIGILIFVLFITNVVLSQNYSTKNIVVDFETLKPIPNVNIYNEEDNTISNSNGLFTFNSNTNSVTISHIGYENLLANLEDLIKSDTVFLKVVSFDIENIVISDKQQLINKVYGSVDQNYPFNSFGEETFIRCVLRKNGEIIKLQDIVANIQRNSLFTNKEKTKLEYSIQILNVRKAGIVSKLKKEEEFELLSIEDLLNWFSSIFTTPKYYKYYQDESLDEKHLKINFIKNESLKELKSLEGFYIVNLEDNSFNRVYYNTVFEDLSKIPFQQKNNVKWRTIANELLIDYKKNTINNKYFINNASLKNIVEVINDNEKNIYEATYQIVNLKTNNGVKIKSNFSSKKDLFRANSNFDNSFWTNQNQLLLDKELLHFIKNIDSYKENYHIHSNFIQ